MLLAFLVVLQSRSSDSIDSIVIPPVVGTEKNAQRIKYDSRLLRGSEMIPDFLRARDSAAQRLKL